MTQLARIAWMPFRIPYRTPFTTAHGTELVREGILLRVETEAGRVGLGEISPVKSFGGGTRQQAERMLLDIAPRLMHASLTQSDALIDTVDTGTPGGAAVRCGLDVALCDLRARLIGLPIAQLLAPLAKATPVAANATIGLADTALACAAAQQAVARGFRCIKLKVGVMPNAEAEFARISAVRGAIDADVELRLDANGAWHPPRAVQMLRALAHLKIDYIEQPVAPNNLLALARLRNTGVSLAADESCASIEDAQRIIAAHAADVLIVKPMMAGGLRPALAICAAAHAAGLRAVVTSTVDSGVGCAAALHLAAALPEPRPACGIATANLLEADLLLKPLRVEQGAMPLPGPGLGVALDPAQLVTYGEGWRSA